MPITIKAARVNAGLTQMQVCEKIGKSKGTLASYESYTTQPDIKIAKELAELFGLKLDDIKWTKE